MKKNEKLAIVGKSGAGKNYLYDKLKEFLPFGIKHTTRPRREKELDGIDYYFIDDSTFSDKKIKGDFFVQESFEIENSEKKNIWHYGLDFNEINQKQLFILTPGEIDKLGELRKKFFIVYLDIPQEIRESRLNIRSDKYDSYQRRFLSDERDFQNFKDYDLKISDSDFDIDLILSLMF